MTKPFKDIPTSLAGYHSLRVCLVESDDLLIPTNSMSTADWSFAYDRPIVIGDETDPCGEIDGFRVYRLNPVPTHLDHLEDKPIPAPAMATAKAQTYDNGKAPLAYLPWEAVKEVAQVQAYGHAKYKDYNNYRKGMEIGRNLSCAVRHIAEYMEGHDLDAESGRSHLAHAACRIMFVLQNLHDGVAIDDRYQKGVK